MTFDWFTNDTCTGSPVANSGNVALSSGTADATGFAHGPLAAGSPYGFKVHYLGNGTSDPLGRPV